MTTTIDTGLLGDAVYLVRNGEQVLVPKDEHEGQVTYDLVGGLVTLDKREGRLPTWIPAHGYIVPLAVDFANMNVGWYPLEAISVAAEKILETTRVERFADQQCSIIFSEFLRGLVDLDLLVPEIPVSKYGNVPARQAKAGILLGFRLIEDDSLRERLTQLVAEGRELAAQI